MIREKPIAVCTKCGAMSYVGTLIGGSCGRTVGGKRCRGVNRSALNETDWAPCDRCAGSGLVLSSRCDDCRGAGWLFVRR
jgi:DnaJ-class molecular chaperone